MNERERKKKIEVVREEQLTYDDYAALGDGKRYELADGNLELMSPAPTVIHQMISFELQRRLHDSCGEDFIVLSAPIDLILSETEVRQPDLILVHRSRLDIIAKHGITGIPDLVIEIISPSTLKRDKLDKLKSYARHRILEYWIIEPELGVLEQHVLRQDDKYELHDIYYQDDIVQSEQLPCARFTMNEIKEQIPDLK